jgi:HK97 family phage major capsid protein
MQNTNTTDPAELVGQIKDAFEDFKARNDGRMNQLQGQIADVASRQAGNMLSGSGAAVPMDGNIHAVNAALRAFVRNGDDSPLAELTGPRAGMSAGSDPDGGYSVIPTLGARLNQRIVEISPMRQIARIEVCSSDTFEELNDIGEAAAAWVGETEARPDTATPQLGKLTIPVHELYAMPKVTQRLLDDSSLDLAAWLVAKCGQQFARKEGQAFITGDGVLKPKGLLTYPTAAQDDDARPWGIIQHVASGADGAFGEDDAADKLVDLVYALKSEYRPNARWLMNRKTAATIRKLKDEHGRFIWSDSLAAGQPDMLLGFPVTLDEMMPAIASGSLSVAFGDFSEAYLIAERQGLRLLRDPFSNKPHVLFYCYRRVGGGLANSEAVKLMKFAAA